MYIHIYIYTYIIYNVYLDISRSLIITIIIKHNYYICTVHIYICLYMYK